MDTNINRDEIVRIATILTNIKSDLVELRKAKSQLIRREKHFKDLIARGLFNESSMKNALVMMKVDLRKTEDLIEISAGKKTHYQNILDSLSI